MSARCEVDVCLSDGEANWPANAPTREDWEAEARSYGLVPFLLAERGPGGGWPLYELSGEAPDLVRFLQERYLGGPSTEGDIAAAGIEIEVLP